MRSAKTGIGCRNQKISRMKKTFDYVGGHFGHKNALFDLGAHDRGRMNFYQDLTRQVQEVL